MANGKVEGLEEIVVEDKITLYRLHPNQRAHFGRIIVSPNIPNIPSKLKEYRKRGFRLNPEQLMPDAKIEEDGNGEIWAVPKGYEIEEFDQKIYATTPTGIQTHIANSPGYRLKKVDSAEGLACDVCGKVCQTKLALSGHKKTHDKKSA